MQYEEPGIHDCEPENYWEWEAPPSGILTYVFIEQLNTVSRPASEETEELIEKYIQLVTKNKA